MNKAERDELAELIVRAINTAREAAEAFTEDSFSLLEWRLRDERACEARRELWQALYSLAVASDPPPSENLKIK